MLCGKWSKNDLVGVCMALLNNLGVWKSGSFTAWQSGSLAVVVPGIDGIERSSAAVVVIGIYGL